MIQQDGIPSTSKSKHKHESVRGRLLDTYRELVPPTPHAHVTEMGSRWRAFADASAYPPTSSSEAGQQVTEDWLVQNGTDYSKPWRAAQSREEKGLRARGLGTKVKRQIWWERSQRIVMRSPVIPLVIRTIVWGFSLIALALGASIYRHVRSNREISLEVEESSINQGTSPEMAIIVDAFALVYLVYITYDEYTGKPLGLRSAKAKVRLIFLDLFFIVFDSANLSLAFEALSVPPTGPEKDKLHSQQKALASVLLIALLAWLMTFSISVLRYSSVSPYIIHSPRLTRIQTH